MKKKSNVAKPALNEAAENIPDATMCVFRHVARTSRAVASFYDRALAPAGLTATQFNLLFTLYRAGPHSVAELAGLLSMEPSGIPRATKPLIARGLLTVDIGEDRRFRIVALTPRGLATLRAAAGLWANTQARVIGVFGEDDWTMMAQYLSRMRRTFRQFDTPSS